MPFSHWPFSQGMVQNFQALARLFLPQLRGTMVFKWSAKGLPGLPGYLEVQDTGCNWLYVGL